jgi:hypothetical protein
MLFKVHTSLLEPDTDYKSEIVFETETGQKETVVVRFTVGNTSSLKVEPAFIDFGKVAYGDILTAKIVVKNAGYGLMKGSLRSTVGWIRLDRRTFEGDYSEIMVTADTTFLDAGRKHIGYVIVQSGKQKELVEISIDVKTWWNTNSSGKLSCWSIN